MASSHNNESLKTMHDHGEFSGEGASIPSALWSLIGAPYVGNYRRAAIVHDRAVQEKTAPRKKADRMFFRACRAGGCSWLQARILYVGVRIGAWLDLNANFADIFASVSNYPRLTRGSAEAKLEVLFQDVCHATLIEEEIEDFEVFEKRVDSEVERRLPAIVR